MLYEVLGFEQNYPIPLFGDIKAHSRWWIIHNSTKDLNILKSNGTRWGNKLEGNLFPENTADVLTKQLTPEKHKKYTKGLGLIQLKGEC